MGQSMLRRKGGPLGRFGLRAKVKSRVCELGFFLFLEAVFLSLVNFKPMG
jgi:hypothetical protein